MHILVRSLTAGAWLVAATAVAAEPLPPVPGQTGEPMRYEPLTGNQYTFIDPLSKPPTNIMATGQNFGQAHAVANATCGSRADRTQVYFWEKWGYPGEFPAAPLGLSVNAALSAQVHNGMSAQMVLYRYDFQQPQIDREPYRLISHGQMRLSKLASLVATAPCPLIIETTGDPQLDGERRNYVITELNRMLPFAVPAEKVVTGVPFSPGLHGVEAEIIDDNLMLQTRNRGLSTLPSSPGRILSPIMSAPANNVNDQ